MNKQEPITEHRTAIVKAFEECAVARARLQTSMISKMGNTNSAFFGFHTSFSELYNLALPNAELRSIPDGKDRMLTDSVSTWIMHAKNWKDAEKGGQLFERLTTALASVGLL